MAAPEVLAGVPEATAEPVAVGECGGTAVDPPGKSIGAAECWLEVLEKPPGLAEPAADPATPGEPPLVTGVAFPEGSAGVTGPCWAPGC